MRSAQFATHSKKSICPLTGLRRVDGERRLLVDHRRLQTGALRDDLGGIGLARRRRRELLRRRRLGDRFHDDLRLLRPAAHRRLSLT